MHTKGKTEHCKRCGRELKDLKSKQLGYGPKCYKKAVLGEQTTIDDYIKPIEKPIKQPNIYGVSFD